MPQVNGERALTKEEYAASVADLQREVKVMRQSQQTGDADADYYLRMMMVRGAACLAAYIRCCNMARSMLNDREQQAVCIRHCTCTVDGLINSTG